MINCGKNKIKIISEEHDLLYYNKRINIIFKIFDKLNRRKDLLKILNNLIFITKDNNTPCQETILDVITMYYRNEVLEKIKKPKNQIKYYIEQRYKDEMNKYEYYKHVYP